MKTSLFKITFNPYHDNIFCFVSMEAQWLNDRVLDSRPKGRGFESLRCDPRARHIYPSLVLVQPRKTRPYITEILLMGRKESNRTNNNLCVCVCARARANLYAVPYSHTFTFVHFAKFDMCIY